MSRPNFDEVLDACVADIVAGRRSVAECLDEWPQFSEQLEPLLEAAAEMHRVPRVAETPPDPARRARFMAALGETPQQPPRRAPLRALAALLGVPRRALDSLGRVGMVAAAAAVVAVAAIAVVLVLNRGATGTASASTLTVFAGGVEQRQGDAWAPLADGATLNEGAWLRTDAQGSALLTFGDGSTAGMEPNTELVVERARVNGARSIRLRQLSGRLWNDVAPDERPGALYVVATLDAVITARGTLFETVVEGGETAVRTTDGLVQVQAGEEQAFVAPGERVSARARRLVAALREAREPDGVQRLRLSVDAPFVASLVAPDGKAVGARPDGIVYHQIHGATTSNPGEGPQTIDLRLLQPGTYQLLLRRVEAGGGEVVIAVGPSEQRFPVDLVGEAVRVELHVSVEDGRLRVRPQNAQAVDPERIARLERVIVTERARERAMSIAEQRARHQAETPPAPEQPRPATPEPSREDPPREDAPGRPRPDGETPRRAPEPQRPSCDQLRDRLSPEALARQFPDCVIEHDENRIPERPGCEELRERLPLGVLIREAPHCLSDANVLPGQFTCNQLRDRLPAEVLARQFSDCVLEHERQPERSDAGGGGTDDVAGTNNVADTPPQPPDADSADDEDTPPALDGAADGGTAGAGEPPVNGGAAR